MNGLPDPRFAPRRDDLPWLRRRRRPRAGTAAPTAPAPARPAISFDRPARTAVSFDRPGRAREPVRPQPPPPPPVVPPPASSTSLDLDTLSGPPRSGALPPPAPVRSTSLDLDAPAVATAGAPVPAAPPTVASAPSVPPRRVRVDDRVASRDRKILTVSDPTVTLTRLQSGIGTLRFEAACSPEVGDLRLGAIYRLRSGLSSTVALPRRRLAPPDSRRPVLVAGHERFARLEVDLRQCAELRRMVLVAFSESRQPLRWGGTLVAETFGGARVEVPLESLSGGRVAVLMSLYNVAGEFVLRAEMQTLTGDLREAARAYGYDRLTWLDDRTPVD